MFHPTGTGKSCIAWKVVEAHPQTTFFWLVAGAQRLALRQAELTRYNGGTLPGNVRFCDCEKLAAATPEQWVRLGEQKPAASCWTATNELRRRVLASRYRSCCGCAPRQRCWGLGVPNGAPVCAAAQELFADCIVSHMTVAEAMAAGTMPVPLSLCSPALASGGGAGHPARPESKTCVCPRATPPCAFNMKS